MRLSNRAKKRMRDKALYCKATGDVKKACDLLHKAIQSENKQIGLFVKKISSKSFVSVSPRAKVTASNRLGYYAKGDYYYTDLNCVFQRAT